MFSFMVINFRYIQQRIQLEIRRRKQRFHNNIFQQCSFKKLIDFHTKQCSARILEDPPRSSGDYDTIRPRDEEGNPLWFCVTTQYK